MNVLYVDAWRHGIKSSDRKMHRAADVDFSIDKIDTAEILDNLLQCVNLSL